MSNANQAAVVGGPGLLSIGGRSLIVQKPSARDLALMQKWIFAQPLANAGGLSAEDFKGLTPEQQVLLIREYAKARGGRRTPTEAEMFEMVSSPGGVAMQVWLAARRDQPGLTLEEIRPLVTPDNAVEIAALLDEALNGPEGGTDDPKAPAGTTSSSPT